MYKVIELIYSGVELSLENIDSIFRCPIHDIYISIDHLHVCFQHASLLLIESIKDEYTL